MTNSSQVNEMISTKVQIDYPDFSTLPEAVQKKFEDQPTKVNFFRMLGHSAGAFIPLIDLTNAIFRDLTISDYHKELLVLMVAMHESVAYEWEQHVSIAQAAGVRPEQFIAIGQDLLDDPLVFSDDERVLLRFGKDVLEKGKAPGVLFKQAMRHFSIQELSDAVIVVGYYRMVAAHIQTFDIPIDAQTDGNWIKG